MNTIDELKQLDSVMAIFDNQKNVEDFLLESNRIENIQRPATVGERKAFYAFLKHKKLEVGHLQELVKAFQENGYLRDRVGMDVRIGNYHPPLGGMHVRFALQVLLDEINSGAIDAYDAHLRYEKLHPFMDGNGRSGRMLWWKMVGGSRIGFLHKFYYQTLDKSGR